MFRIHDCEECRSASFEFKEWCEKHTPRKVEPDDHREPAQPEAHSDDGKTTIQMELLSLGVPPMRYLTPEERAKDLVEWRQRIAEHNKGATCPK